MMIDPDKRKRIRLAVYAMVSFALLLTLLVCSLIIGPTFIPLPTFIDYLLDYDPNSKDHLILHTLRIPRALATILVGSSLATAGCMMQALTRNPLASPSVFGINAGASFIIVLSVVLLPGLSGLQLTIAGFAGGLLAAVLIFVMSAALRGGRMDVKMALIGVVIQALLGSFTQGLLIFNEESASQLLFWLAGSIAGTDWRDIGILLPTVSCGLILAFMLSRSLSLISLGDDIARGLGQRIWAVRIAGSMIVIMLAGTCVSVVGPIGFVGLIVPHMTRYLTGNNYRLLIPFSALLGAILMTAADVVSRFIHFPSETPAGIVTALIGAPYFVYLARRQGRRLA